MIKLQKEIKVLTSLFNKIWENNDGCEEQYRCASALYLISFMLQCYSIKIDCGISAPVHDKDVVGGLNNINKGYIYQLMSNVQLPRSKTIDSHILIHYSTKNNDVSLVKESQKCIYLRNVLYMGSLIRENKEKNSVKENR